MSKLRNILLGAVVVASLGVMIPAAGATAGCVSRSEFRAVNDGMLRSRVHAIFDTAGTQQSFYTIGGDTYETREYKPCTDKEYGFVWIDYENRRVEDKYVYWG